ncbi:PREDICTED: UPF0562 protein v1g242151-like [Acropora digitifera]|uniref:UPF0562 protein v1g242151-like n=1 Tax=Acropora digitifera TaxID=70779 RepID=UPI00077AEEBF|nr:PREDICTED: UPF0562 protein v1g242151-like [Acropora digitifera]
MASLHLQVLRKIMRELKLISPRKEPVKSTIEGQYLMSLYRQFSQVEVKIANLLYCQSLCYLCLLESQRLTQAIHAKYKGGGERSVEETAGLVGYKLPKQYQEPS